MLDDIGVELLRDFFYEGKERFHWSYWHYCNHYKYLKKFLGWCVENGYSKVNPMDKIRKPKKPQSLPRRLTHQQAQSILYTSFNYRWRYKFERPRNHAIIATLLYTGLRARELINLQMVDVNLGADVILVRSGKGNKDRYVPVHSKLSYILKQYLIERMATGKMSPYFFTSALRDEPLCYQALGKICRRISGATGVKFTPHCLRHTFGSVAIEQDMGLVQLKEIMGHSNISSTMIYLKMSPAGLKTSLNRLDLF
ncbi:MAG: tyrosine-type recombinase/integrase [Deltaproteobacteria bacterium]|nr:tyrosine-type recombinase/integrase [Deltaproteobacteria bacterium]